VQSCAATCVATCAATCAATCPANATCAPGCPTHHVTCAAVCTNFTPCVTRGQPDCPFPTEIPAQCTFGLHCRPPGAAQAVAGAPGAAIVNTGPVVCQASAVVVCSLACPTLAGCHSPICPSWHYTCGLGCPPRTPLCPTLIGATCAPHLCTIGTCNPDICGIASGVLGCGGGGGPGGPVEQAQLCLAGSVRPPQVTVDCTIGGFCQSLPCPSWQYTCGWGCPPRTPQCPW
jgi:hypothetical protein